MFSDETLKQLQDKAQSNEDAIIELQLHVELLINNMRDVIKLLQELDNDMFANRIRITSAFDMANYSRATSLQLLRQFHSRKEPVINHDELKNRDRL